MTSLLEKALEYANRGWHVTPDHSITIQGICTCPDLFCKVPGKHPRIERSPGNDALRREGSKDPQQISEWWEKWPNSNIAICCGKHSNLVVVDIDPRNDGFDSLDRLEAEHGRLKDTLTSRSGGNGLHLYFMHPKNEPIRNRNGLFPGIDIKADGGRIVAPPSKHYSGRVYEWVSPIERTRLRMLPPWLLNMIQHQQGTGSWQAMRRKKSQELR